MPLLLLFLLAVTPLHSQKPSRLTIDRIMEGPKFVGTSPADVRWSGDSSKVYFRWKAPDEDAPEEAFVYEAGRDGGAPRRLSEQEARRIPPQGGQWDQQRRNKLVAEQGDIVLADTVNGERRKLTETFEQESDPRFTSDFKKVSFTRNNNLFVLSLEGGQLRQVTDIRAPGAATPPAGRDSAARETARIDSSATNARASGRDTGRTDMKSATSQKSLEDQQKELFDVLRERMDRQEREKKRSEALGAQIKPFLLTPQQNVSNLRLTPDEKSVTFVVNDRPSGTRSTVVPSFVTRTGYTEDIPSRTKVGDVSGRTRVAMWKIETGEVTWVDHGQGERAISMQAPEWSEDGHNAFILARADDDKDRWMLLLDMATGKTRVLDHLHDDAWISGPGSFTAGWMPDGREIYFVSEKTGYAHLYVVSLGERATPRALTSGNFEIYDLQLSKDKADWYLGTNEIHPGERHFYRMPLQGGARTRLTANPGFNGVTLAPDESSLAIVYSFANKPPELYISDNRPEAPPRQVTTSTRFEFRSYPWRVPEFVTFRARDGATVYARLYKPDAPARKSRPKQTRSPAILFVHGAGYLQNAHKWWSTYYREYMFHHILLENGYVVLDIDYRGSAGYGRDWRTGIYRHMGGKDLDDNVDGARWLVAQHNVDAGRIGLYGGSYGGFITLMALFTTPDVFAAGAALRPVTDWAHYNEGYTSNILNLPQQDHEAYRKSSPIYFAQGLKGALLICHGMVDANVHFQDTVRLTQRLIELRKENWEVAMYPVEDHAFTEATSWADEYKRIFKLFEKNLKESPVANR
ncbi:MAG: prolyl oligopeptidase family serine peptidase [Acidobacteriota bacterium]